MRLSIFILLLIVTGQLCAQRTYVSTGPKELFEEVFRADSIFFQSLNNCNLKTYASFLSDDFEFYHDKTGLTKSKTAEMKSMESFCGEQRKRQQLRRELIKESVEIGEIKHFGVIHTGRHRFYLVIDDKNEKLIEVAKFVNLWQLQDSGWKLSRVISYDHQLEGKAQLDSATLNLYPGKYKMKGGNVIVISKNGGLLRAMDADWNANLYPESKTSFYLDYGNTQFKFLNEPSGRIEKLMVYENDILVDQGNRVD